tara:strand:- start:485 stop:658 length:174 start_codon:yes stop_codon:yes gene_type:complete
MNIENAKYIKRLGKNEVFQVKATIDGEELWIPMSESNRHYAAILEWVADGNTIEEAD